MLRKFNRCARDEGSIYKDLFSAQPTSKVSDAQQVIICQYFQEHFFSSVLSTLHVLQCKTCLSRYDRM